MNIQMIKNPNPIKLNADEQKALDTISEKLWKKIFSKAWVNSNKIVGNNVIFDEKVMITAFGQKPRLVRINVRGKKKRYNRNTWSGFGFTSGLIRTSTSRSTGEITRQEISINLNGYAEKYTFAELYKNDPFKFFIGYIGFLSTIRHEIIHAKDPVAQNATGYGTSTVSKKFGHMHYVNDPARLEIRSHMGEWDLLFSEIQNIIKNKDKDDYHKEVYSHLKYLLCVFQHNFRNSDDKAKNLFTFLTPNNPNIKPFVPKELRNRLRLYYEFSSISDAEARKSAKLYEKALQESWSRIFEEKSREYKRIKAERDHTREIIIHEIEKGRKKYKNRAELMNQVKILMKTEAPKLPSKPKLKTKFTQKEMKNILDNREKNYRESIQTIYTLMKQKGLLDKSLCSSEISLSDKAREKRAMTLLKRDKSVIYSLMKRFENLE
jgi:hypothetical protein